MSGVTDQLFGTRTYTAGALYQKPRKIPLRVEPKTYFALERTFLSWAHMAVLMGGITSALVGFNVEEENTPQGAGRRVTQKTTQVVSLLLLPLAMLMISYALFVYYFRSRNLQQKQYGFYNDRLGPVVLCSLIMAALTFIMCVAVSDFFSSA